MVLSQAGYIAVGPIAANGTNWVPLSFRPKLGRAILFRARDKISS